MPGLPEQAAPVTVAVAAAQAAASAAETRVQALEAELARLQAATKEQSETLLKLQSRVAQDPQQGPWVAWLPWIAALAGLAMALAAWLAWRLHSLSQEAKRAAWWTREGQTSMMESRIAETDIDESSVRMPAPVPVVAPRPAAVMPPTAMLRTPTVAPTTMTPETIPAPVPVALSATMSRQVRPVQTDMQVEAHRAVTVDEQIDLEQQADFFIALGHDDAAIDLLLAHLRGTGGTAPLPYLKLLEMYRRRGDRDDYEVMRRRFNQRFNSVAPEWDHDGHAGRTLEEYGKQISRLQAVWPKPLDAMAELEAMAFGRGNDTELFDLPAYQDVMFLYQMARQLHDDSGQGQGSDVDVLLPIATGESGAAPMMTPLASSQGMSNTVLGGLDLDISSEIGRLARPPAMPQIDLDLPPLSKKPKR